MNIALFGGTFDPVHSGHLAAAAAARKAFHLDQVLFVPGRRPPHKLGRGLTPFAHRYAMVALACSGRPEFVPSLLEADDSKQPNYSIVTIQKMAARMGKHDRLFFLIGADAFLSIGQWKEPAMLLDACDFIVASRPGFAISKIVEAIPRTLLKGEATGRCIALRHRSVHLLRTVKSSISGSAIRRRARDGKPLTGLVPATVQDYIEKQNLFLDEQPTE